MRYLGGKSRIARQIVAHLPNGSGIVYEPFCGGAAVTVELAKKYDKVWSSDSDHCLISLWKLVQGGFLPPTTLTDEEYQRLKEYEPQSIEEEALKAFVGYGCSFGGKWCGGRARGGVNADGTPRNHVAESSRAIQKQAQFFGDHVSFDTQDYRNINPSSGDIVYCDPPYRNTTEYKTQFNHDEFWEWANGLVDRGVIVYVSEVSAPEGWKSVWSVSQHRSVKRAGDITTVEKLYIGERP